MSQILFQYQQVEPTTWVYLSSLLMIGLFFKFNRFWSVRNLDLVLLILLAPGLLLVLRGIKNQEQAEEMARKQSVLEASPNELPSVTSPTTAASLLNDQADTSLPLPKPADTSTAAASPTSETVPPSGENAIAAGQADLQDAKTPLEKAHEIFNAGQRVERIGYIWLFVLGGIFLVRLMLDPTMVRRPLLEPNLSIGGLIFIGCSLFVFLMANVVTSKPTEADLQGPRGAAQLLARETTTQKNADLREYGPGYAVLNLLIGIPTYSVIQSPSQREPNAAYAIIAKIMAIVSHLFVIVGIVAIGYQHFANLRMGVGAATLYLMLPYTALMTGLVLHVLPAALMVWAVLNYRRPLIAGIFIGLAMGVVYYPLFLLPLWLSFYWQRGVLRFVLGIVATLFLLTMSLIFVSTDSADFWSHVQAMFGLWLPVKTGLEGFWKDRVGWDPVYRIPILAAFVALSGTLAIWPAQKNLGTLLSCSAAIMVATQFWHGHGGGLFMAWYLPLALLTIFRPNLEDRIALTVLGEGWVIRKKAA